MPIPEPVISGDTSVSTQSLDSLKLAVAFNLLTYRKTVELRAGASIAHLRDELGPDVEIPTDDGLYYWVYIPRADGGDQPMLIPEGEVQSTCRVLAARHGRDMARRFEWRPGVIPA